MASVETSERLLRWLHVGAADACVCVACTGSHTPQDFSARVASVRISKIRHSARHRMVLYHIKRLGQEDVDEKQNVSVRDGGEKHAHPEVHVRVWHATW